MTRSSSARAGYRLRVGALAALLAVALTFILAASPETGLPLPGTQPRDGSGDPAFPAFSNGAGQPGTLDSPSSCSGCHGGYRQSGEPIYEPTDSWSGSLMANSARDPLFWAAVDIANQDDERVLGNVGVGEFCIKCHVPQGYLEGRADCDTPWGRRYDGACLDGPANRRDNDFEGISCHFCHRLYDASQPPAGDFFDESAPYLENGSFFVSQARDVMRGPFSDAEPPNHQWAVSEYHKSSAFCGECHTVTSPARNRRDPDTGADLGYKLPVDRTYREWTQSVYADPQHPQFASCQSCHMPVPDLDGDGDGDPAVACTTPPGLRGFGSQLDGPIRSHFFRGASTFMLQLLKGEYGRALRREASFDAALEQSFALLQEDALRVEVSTPEVVQAGSSFVANVKVLNLGGHKFPTGYIEGRRAFVNVRAGEDLDGDGVLASNEITFESGKYDPTTALIVKDDQLRVYEAQVGIWNFNGTGRCDIVDESTGHKMFNFAINDCILFDNRIPPLGFTPDDETAPVGVVYPDNPALPGTLANWDSIDYAIPVPEPTYRPFLVDAAVYYQTVTRDYIEFLRIENESTCDPFDSGCDPTKPDARPNRGEKMQSLWQRYGRSAPVLVKADSTALAVEGGTPPPPGEAGDPSDPSGALRVEEYDAATGAIRVSYANACQSSDHALYWGDLANVATYEFANARCSIGIGGEAWFQPGPGSVFFLVAGSSGIEEGSYGVASNGAERPEDTALCPLPQNLTASCQ